MWLPILLLTVMASGSACPDFCQCRSPVIECGVHAPELSELEALSSNFTEFRINGIERKQLQSYIGNVLTSTFFQRLKVLEVTNCSELSNDNNYRNWHNQESKGVDILILPNIAVLNVSYNKLIEFPWHYKSSKNNSAKLHVLDVSHNHISSVAFMDSEQVSQLNWLSLANNELDYISPSNFKYFELLEYLDMSDNVLHTLAGIFDSLRSLQRLNVAGNKLEHVQADWFQSLSKLVQLDISRNKMTFIPADTLQPLASLSVFNLAENPLIERDLSLLLGTGRRLEVVDASRIGLIRVPAALTHSVRTLKLAGNQLTSINSGDLDSYPLLKSLILSDNRLMIIEEDALGRLDNLEDLIFSGNILPSIPKSLPNCLKILDLSQNAISILKVNDLQGLYVLEELNLSGNVISIIEEGSFRQLPRLRSLDISENPIKKLPSDSLSGPTNLITLRMSGLMSIVREENQNHDTAFPILTPERLVALDVSRSPVLAALLLADNAALSACKSLQELNLSYTNLSSIRSDLAYILPQLRKLNLIGNKWNCSADQFWLGEWIRKHQASMKLSTRCAAPVEVESMLLEELPNTLSIDVATNVKFSTIPSTLKATEDKHSTFDYEIIDTNKLKKNKEMDNLIASLPISKDSVNSYLTTNDSLSIDSASESDFTTLSPKSIVFSILPLKVENLQIETTKEESMSQISQVISSPTKKLSSSTHKEDFPNFSTTSESEIYITELTSNEPTSFTTTSTTTENAINIQDAQKSVSLSSNIFTVTPYRNRMTTEENVFTITVNVADTTMTDVTTTDPVTIVSNNINNGFSKLSGRHNKDISNTITVKKQEENIVTVDESLIIKSKDSRESVNQKAVNKVMSDFSHSKLLFTNEESSSNIVSNSFAEELSSQATESGARISESLASGAHPGMLVLLGAAIGAAVALTVVLSRRATIKRRDRQYQRHENIEVHALTPTTELW